MQSIHNRILAALELGPATTRQLALMLGRTYDYIARTVKGLHERGQIIGAGYGRGHPVGRMAKLYRLPDAPISSHKPKPSHPWVRYGKAAIRERERL